MINKVYSKTVVFSSVHVAGLLICIIFSGCHRNLQDTPESVVETFAQSMASMDVESAMSCFEYGDEILSMMTGLSGSDFSASALQSYITAAKESELLPEITYEIVSSDINEDKGTIKVKFSFRFDDGETVHESTDEEVFPVYFHEGQWWIGEGYSKSQREMAKRGMKFLEKISSQRNGF